MAEWLRNDWPPEFASWFQEELMLNGNALLALQEPGETTWRVVEDAPPKRVPSQPTLAGPFPTLEGAKVAIQILADRGNAHGD